MCELSMSCEICFGPSPRSRRSLLAQKVEAAPQAAWASLTAMSNLLIDTLVQWIRRRASATLALDSHSLSHQKDYQMDGTNALKEPRG
jgi:hypothetical protein